MKVAGIRVIGAQVSVQIAERIDSAQKAFGVKPLCGPGSYLYGLPTIRSLVTKSKAS